MSINNHGPIAWMVRNPVSANILMLVLLLGGALLASQIKKEVFPEFELDVITIDVSVPGATPEEVEQGVLLAIEDALESVDGILTLSANAREGSGSVTVELDASTNMQTAYQSIQQAVDGITTLPQDAEQPRIAQKLRRRDVMELRLYGDVDAFSLQRAAEQVRDALLQHESISQVDLEGAQSYEIHIDVAEAELRRYQLTLQSVADIIRNYAVERSGGALELVQGDILLRLNQRKDWAHEFALIPILTLADGTVLRLEQLAQVSEGFANSDTLTTFNGAPAIGLRLFRVGDETPQSVADAAYAVLPTVMATLPPTLQYAVQDDDSLIYQARLQLLLKNGLIGLGLVLLLLSIFLEFRLAFWVAMGIPTAFLGAFWILVGLDVSINMVSMFAFIVALGIVVDDAIIAGENIYDYRQQGLPFTQAAIRGAQDIAQPISFSILTNMVAFLPLAFIPGGFGQIWWVIPVVVISVFAISWIEALFILPMHLSRIQSRHRSAIAQWLHVQQQRFSYGFTTLIRRYYQPAIVFALRYRYVSLALSVGLLMVVMAIPMSGRMGLILMPKIESDYSAVTVRFAQGTPLEQRLAVRDQLEQAITQVIAENGAERLGMGTFAVLQNESLDLRAYLTAAEVRPLSTSAVTRLWRQRAGTISGVESIKFEADRGGPGRGANITVELSHSDSQILEQAAQRLGEQIAEFGASRDIDTGIAGGKLQYNFALTAQAQSLGLTAQAVAQQIRDRYLGAEVLRQQRGANEVKVLVRLPDAERRSAHAFEQMVLQAPNGGEILLSEATQQQQVQGYTQIQRTDGRRILQVTANVEPISETNRILSSIKADILPQLMQDYPGLSARFEGRQASMRDALTSFQQNVGLALLVMFVLLAIAFGNYHHPMVVMLAIPFGLMGAILGHLLMGYNISLISMMGMIALSGVVINDSLVMIDYANARRREGWQTREAIVQAAVRRFRPILLTTITTFGGLAPMIFETSRQARFMIPMAISLGYGILFATAIMLLFIPCCYLAVEDIRNLLLRPVRKKLG